MPDPNVEATGWGTKLILYIVGASLGLCAKLAHMKRRKDVTLTDALVESAIAAAASFLVWSFFHYQLHNDEEAIIAAVIAGRYGDDVLLTAIHKIEKWLDNRKT